MAVNYSTLLALIGLSAAIPLNINLGAYSPALVVGDGEISFGGNQDISTLMTALEGAAINAASAAAPAARQAAGEGLPTEGLAGQAEQLAAVQGKQLNPRDPELAPPLTKRQLAGFDRALQFAEIALTRGPRIEIGTGAPEGAGVGIIVDNNDGRTGAAEVATEALARNRRLRRSLEDETAASAGGKQRRARVTTLFIRSGIPEALRTSARDLKHLAVRVPESDPAPENQDPAATAPAPLAAAKQDANPAAIDVVNLNVDGDKGVTMTLVETVDEDGDEE